MSLSHSRTPKIGSVLVAAAALSMAVPITVTNAGGHGDHVYGPYPVTLKRYSGDETNSVSYNGQVGRQLLHNSLKKAVSSGASLSQASQGQPLDLRSGRRLA